jgi:hypothetical protein
VSLRRSLVSLTIDQYYQDFELDNPVRTCQSGWPHPFYSDRRHSHD